MIYLTLRIQHPRVLARNGFRRGNSPGPQNSCENKVALVDVFVGGIRPLIDVPALVDT
jgi:hypothetical protein